MKNYYKTMGLKPTATEKEIKSAYRLLAKRYHPDVNPGNAAAAEKFADLTEAYGILSDPAKKAEYDRQVSEMLQQRAGQGGGAFNNNPYSAYAQNQYPNGYAQYAQAQAQYAQAQAQAQARQQQYAQVRRQYAQAQYAQQHQQQQQYAQQQQSFANRYAQYAQAQQAQIQQLVKKVAEAQKAGYAKGFEAGTADATRKMTIESDKLKAEIEIMKHSDAENKAEIARLKRQLDATESDFEAMKIGFFDAEEKMRAEIDALDAELEKMREEQAGKSKRAASDSEKIKSLKEKLAECEKTTSLLKSKLAETESSLAETTGRLLKKETTLTDMKLENNKLSAEKKFFEDEYEKARALVEQQKEEIEMLNDTVSQWEDFSDSIDTAEAMKNLKSQWEKELREAKKKLKNTYYGKLGILHNATEEEVKESFRKIVKRYTKKAETDKAYEVKLQEVNEAFKVLSNAKKRAAYNAEIGVTDEEIAVFNEDKRKHEESMERLENEQGERDFWAYVEDLMYSAQTGDAESQVKLGEMYLKGDELEKDVEQAVYWFKEGAKLKYPRAYFMLGVCFILGEGVEKDTDKAEGFLKQAVKAGYEPAVRLIESGYSTEVIEDELDNQ